ncbi:hypothetical protein SKAU_G00294950 [Synaphobranchus kaupii]|uniref:Bromodomain containing 4 n=1 Tax=Synaphobranchus kaupii TaxID=118154 RepID=A0A9Q1EUH5_SYNKA|nr:hypothetical protein SKAU_G00294950 [Synaphobranchus kaupii]
MPISQVQLFLQHLQGRPAPAPPSRRRRSNTRPPGVPLIPQQQPSPRQHKPQPYGTGHARENPSPQMPQYPPISRQTPPHLQPPKKHEQRVPQAHRGMKEEKLPVIQGEPFSPALRQEPQKHLDSKPTQPAPGPQRMDLKPLESSRPVIRSSESSIPPQPTPEKEKFKQEPKTPVAPKKVQDVKLKNMGSWASLAQRSASAPSSTLKSSSDSFEQFRRAAREKEEREKALKAQAEQAEKERLRREQEKMRTREEEEVVEQTRRPPMEEPRRRQEQQHAQTQPPQTQPQPQPQAASTTPPLPAPAPPPALLQPERSGPAEGAGAAQRAGEEEARGDGGHH